jgi:hypothetical protein
MRRAFVLLAALWLAFAPVPVFATPATWAGVYGVGGIAAVTGVATHVGDNPSCGSSPQATTGKNIPQGALIVVWTSSITNNVTAVNDTVGNNYVLVISQVDPAGFNLKLWYAPNATAMPAGDQVTLTRAGVSGACYFAASAFVGVSASGPLDMSNKTSGTGTNPSVSSGALSDPFELVTTATFVDAGNTDTFTESAGYTTDTTLPGTTGTINVLHTAYKIVSTSASVAYAPTLGTSRGYAALIGTFVGVQ